MVIKEIHSKTILSVSKIHDYVINPYVGCQHACSYCYARFIKKFSGHHEPWGEFVDIRTNAADLLRVGINKKRCARVWVSGLCDPYQPLEEKYQLSRKCLEILVFYNWPVTIQIRSSLVLRDLDIIKSAKDMDVGLSVTTADDEVRKIFEPMAPPIHERINTLDILHQAGVRTYAMIAPILPGAEDLIYYLNGKVDYILVDRMNYHYCDWIYKKYQLTDKLSDDYFQNTGRKLADDCRKSGIDCNLVF